MTNTVIESILSHLIDDDREGIKPMHANNR